ncbi:hypothetical protein SedNR2807_23320 [Citrobacter sedlakii]
MRFPYIKLVMQEIYSFPNYHTSMVIKKPTGDHKKAIYVRPHPATMISMPHSATTAPVQS